MKREVRSTTTGLAAAAASAVRRSPLIIALTAVAVASASAALAQNGPLPRGPGREPTLRLCSSCHTVELVIAQRRTRLGWKETIARMVDHGLVASESDMTQVATYLATHYGPLNQATPIRARGASPPASPPPRRSR